MSIGRQALSILVGALLATAGSLVAQGATQSAAQGAEKPQEQQEQKADAGQEQAQQQTQGQAQSQPAAPAKPKPTGPQITGTVVMWNGDRIDLKTEDGKTHKIAVNRDTEQLVKVASGAQVIVEYRRKVGGFVIAQRIRPAGETAAATDAAASETPSLTAEVVSWNDSALVVKTKEGEVTFFLAPTTEYLVKSLDPGLQVIVEYSQDANGARMATRVRAAEEKGAKKQDGR